MPQQEVISYEQEKNRLRVNLNGLFTTYSPRLLGESQQALIDLINAGKMMLDESEVMYMGLFYTWFPDNEAVQNCTVIKDVYDKANEVIEELLQANINPGRLSSLTNEFTATMALRIPKTHGSQRALAALAAFEWALVGFCGVALLAMVACPPVAVLIGSVGAMTLGAAIGYSLLGIASTLIGTVMAYRPAMIALDRGYKSSHKFKDSLTLFGDTALVAGGYNEGQPPAYEQRRLPSPA